jgi:hypothetical protein
LRETKSDEPFLPGAYHAEEERLTRDETEEPGAYRERQNERIGKMLMDERMVKNENHS